MSGEGRGAHRLASAAALLRADVLGTSTVFATLPPSTSVQAKEHARAETHERPLLMVDIDGVISLFGGSQQRGWSGGWAMATARSPTAPFIRSTAHPTSFRSPPPLTCLSSRRRSSSCGRAAGRSGPTSTCPTCWGSRQSCRSALRACRRTLQRALEARRDRSVRAWAPACMDRRRAQPRVSRVGRRPRGADAARADGARPRAHFPGGRPARGVGAGPVSPLAAKTV